MDQVEQLRRGAVAIREAGALNVRFIHLIHHGQLLLERQMTNTKLIRLAILAAVLSMPLAIAACNTVEGAGQDIQKGGRAIENSADRNK